MVGVGPDEGGGRRLPQWMVGASVTAQLEKPETTKLKKKNRLLSQTSDPDPKPKKTQRRKESLLVEEESLSLKSSHVLTKCGTKRSKGKEKREEADSNFSVSVDLVPEKKCNRARRKLPESSASRKSSEEPEIKPLSENDDEDEDDDEEELTVEDLVTIAKEYVRKDKTTEQDRASKRNYEQRDKSTTMVLSRNDYERNTEGAQICIETTTRNDTSTSTSTFFSESETVISAGGTGDPAQDMLDLFLGPLLKKPVNEKKPDVLSDDVAFSREFEIRDKAAAVKDELAPQVTKKKSSLKDKIAMFI